MIAPEDYEREDERLAELDSYSILDTLPESDFDNLTSIAATICNTPISLVSLLDDKRQWFKSRHGLQAAETSKDLAFCGHAIHTETDVFEITDARKDERFFDNPLVTGEPYVIFYAGIPLVSANGLPMGTLCVIDDKPKKLTPAQIQSLGALSKQVMNLFELRRNKIALERTILELEDSNQNLERFAQIAAHDLKSPINTITSISQFIQRTYGEKLDSEAMKWIAMIQASSTRLRRLIEGLLDISKSSSSSHEIKERIRLKRLLNEIDSDSRSEGDASIILKTELEQILANRTVVYHVLINLVSNAIRYNDKDVAIVEVGVEETDRQYRFYVSDNGPGIAHNLRERVFELFGVPPGNDKHGRTGSGIGLASVKKMLEKSGGSIAMESELGMGSTFSFSLDK